MEGRHRGRAWTIRDRCGNEVYLTWERWEHVIEFHPEMEPFFEDIRICTLCLLLMRRRLRHRWRASSLWPNCFWSLKARCQAKEGSSSRHVRADSLFSPFVVVL
jgi:hypothetical protein